MGQHGTRKYTSAQVDVIDLDDRRFIVDCCPAAAELLKLIASYSDGFGREEDSAKHGLCIILRENFEWAASEFAASGDAHIAVLVSALYPDDDI